MKRTLGLFLTLIMMTTFIVGCTPKSEDNSGATVVDIKEIHEKIKDEFGEDYIPNMNLGLEELEAMIGVKGEDIEKHIAEIPMISVNVDTFIAIEAKEGKADNVEKDLEGYRQNLLNNSMQYPMNQGKVNAAKVVRHGNYVFFIMIGKYDDRNDISEEEALKFAKEEIEKAENIINSFFK